MRSEWVLLMYRLLLRQISPFCSRVWGGIGVFFLFALGAQAAADFRYVQSSVARLRRSPQANAEVTLVLRIAEKVKVLKRKGKWAKVQAWVDGVSQQPATGWVKTALLARKPPQLDDMLAKFEDTVPISERRHLIERATALAPADEQVIQALIDTLDQTRDERAQYLAQKGMVAAKKRNASWDGPLYPTLEGLTYLPQTCDADLPALADSRRERLSTPQLRARAFEIVDSGKVVSVTTSGYQTQLLDRRVCAPGPCGPQLAYLLPRKATSGALVPSWMVAGHQVTGYRSGLPQELKKGFNNKYKCSECNHFTDSSQRSVIQVHEAKWRVLRRDFAGWRAQPWQEGERPYALARPMARFDERDESWRILWLAENAGTAGCAKAHASWLVRLRWGASGDIAGLEEGRVYFSSPASPPSP